MSPLTSANIREATRALNKETAQKRRAGALSSLGSSSCLYSPKCLEAELSEVRRRTLTSVPMRLKVSVESFLDDLPLLFHIFVPQLGAVEAFRQLGLVRTNRPLDLFLGQRVGSLEGGSLEVGSSEVGSSEVSSPKVKAYAVLLGYAILLAPLEDVQDRLDICPRGSCGWFPSLHAIFVRFGGFIARRVGYRAPFRRF
jgi:hypothetical protein